MADDFHRPVLFSGRELESYAGSEDPAERARAARETARALVARVRDRPDAAVLERLVHFTDEHGIDALAELWARSAAHSLPGALWRIYLIRLMIVSDGEGVALLFARGTARLDTIDPVVAGAPSPASPDEVLEVADEILRGVFAGDFALALDRAAAFCRVCAAGAADLADDHDVAEQHRAAELTTRALRLTSFAEDLTASARLARADSLD